jgi:hypothetical protein
MTNFNQHSTAESYADMNVAISYDDLIAWVAEYGTMAQTCIKIAMDDTPSDSLYEKIQAGHWEFLRGKWLAWRADQDESDQHQADIEKTDESLRRWFCWQSRH